MGVCRFNQKNTILGGGGIYQKHVDSRITKQI